MTTHTYHDLTLYWQSPRAWAFREMGYRPRPKPGPMTTGTLTHKAIEMWWKGEKDIARVLEAEKNLLLEDESFQGEALFKNVAKALEWATRYVEMFGAKYIADHIEAEFMHGNVAIHPDLLAWAKDGQSDTHLIVIDYKTTADPYIPAYHQSMQLDLYAYVFEQCGHHVPEIAYHVISDGKIYESARPPDKRIGEYVYNEVAMLSVVDRSWALEQERPYYQAGRTGYWEAEMQYREDGLLAAIDYMEDNMEKVE